MTDRKMTSSLIDPSKCCEDDDKTSQKIDGWT